MGIMRSMGSVGNAYDNAMAENFLATLKRELLNRRRFKTQTEARLAVFEWIEGWYNLHRRHSSLDTCHPSTTRGDCQSARLRSFSLLRTHS